MIKMGLNYQALYTKNYACSILLPPTVNCHKRSLIEQAVGIVKEAKILGERVTMSLYTYIAYAV